MTVATTVATLARLKFKVSRVVRRGALPPHGRNYDAAAAVRVESFH